MASADIGALAPLPTAQLEAGVGCFSLPQLSIPQFLATSLLQCEHSGQKDSLSPETGLQPGSGVSGGQPAQECMQSPLHAGGIQLCARNAQNRSHLLRLQA